jgi:hypothetical protein
MFPAGYRWRELNPVLSRDPDRGDTDGSELTALFDPSQKRPAGSNPSFQDRVTTIARACGKHLLGQAATTKVANGEGDLGAPEVHSEDYRYGTPSR